MSAGPRLIVTRVSGIATVQDLGRPGYMHMGVPPGGPLVPALFARANVAVGNAPNDAGLELVGGITLRAESAVTIARSDGDVRTLSQGDELAIEPSAVPRYLAARGGLDVPLALGGRGTLLAAALGGYSGRPLRRGDTLEICGGSRLREASVPPPDPASSRGDGAAGSESGAELIASRGRALALRVVAGPDLDCFVGGIDALLAVTWRTTARRDRVGARLDGGRIARRDHDALDSRPMVRGAIQVPPSGEPIVLGPDHPTTGGYPIIAVVAACDVGVLYMRPVGAVVAFDIWR